MSDGRFGRPRKAVVRDALVSPGAGRYTAAMQIFRHADRLPEACRGGVVTLGNFDGVHRGHQAIIARARAAAEARRAPLVVVTFEPHPGAVFRPEAEPFRLTPFRSKASHLAALGVEVLVNLHFDLEFSKVSAADFVRRILVDALAATHLVVGQDFAFGHRRQGNAAFLVAQGETHGFGVEVAEPVREPGSEIYSSSLIRDCLRRGEPARAAELLGRAWEIDGRVVAGDRRGHALGFPTANLELGEFLRPKFGVYAVRAGIDEGEATEWRDGAANIGTRPTVDGATLLLEVHLFDFSGDLYGKHLRVALIDYLRPEEKFDGLDALKAQIAEDCRQARRILAAGED